jgi:hydroxypyruvate isomerase
VSALRQGFSFWCFKDKGVGTDDLFAGAKKIGYEAVDLVDESLWPTVRKHGLKIGAVAGHAGIEEGLNRKQNFPRIEAELRANIDKAVAWKIPTLICFSGNRNGLNDDAGLEVCAEHLAKVAPYAEKAGVILAVELLNSKVDHKDYQCDSTQWGVRLCERVGSPAVKLLFDIYHMQIMEGDLIRSIQSYYPHFAHYHTAGNPGRGQPDDSQEINYAAVYQAIVATSADPMVSHEFIPKGDPLRALELAFHQLKNAC